MDLLGAGFMHSGQHQQQAACRVANPAPALLQMNGWSREQVAAEVLGGRSALASQCGIPSADIVGWRQPYLQAAPVVRQVGGA